MYTSESIALAKLEVLANASGKVPVQQALITLEFPDDSSMTTVLADELPTHWYRFPYPAELVRIIGRWIEEGKNWIMQVPSAQSRQEFNYLFNPQHPTYASLQLIDVNAHEFDQRLKS